MLTVSQFHDRYRLGLWDRSPLNTILRAFLNHAYSNQIYDFYVCKFVVALELALRH